MPRPADYSQLRGYSYYRVDSGEYRIIYRFDAETVYIVLIGKRNGDEVYDKLKAKWVMMKMNRTAFIYSILLPISCALVSVAHACEVKITWKAALTTITGGNSAALSPAMGTAAIDFDLAHPGATVQVDTKNLQDVQAIELHVARSYTAHTGPAVLTLYTASDGPLPTTLTRHLTDTDLHKQALPKVAAFSDVVSAVLNGQAYVTVTTKAHPQGELSGFIRMHKEEVYSDSASDSTHDAALHHAIQSRAAAPAP